MGAVDKCWSHPGYRVFVTGAGVGGGWPQSPRGPAWGGEGFVGRLRTFTNYTRTRRSRQFCGFPRLCRCDLSVASWRLWGWNLVPLQGHRVAAGNRTEECHVETDVEVAP